MDNTVLVKLNPEIHMVPRKFERYRHPSHNHKMFMLLGLDRCICDNDNCKKHIKPADTIFCCFKCDYFLCDACFQLDGSYQMEISPDDCTICDCTYKPLSEHLVVNKK
jgi:hypothetical protein